MGFVGVFRSVPARARRPSPALIVAALALVTSVGGNAAAAVIISSNHQVAAHVIGGADAPASAIHNLMSGSIGTADLHAGAVTPNRLADDARAHRIAFHAIGASTTNSTILTLDELTLSGKCVSDSGTTLLQVLFKSSIAADLQYFGEVTVPSAQPFISDVKLTANVGSSVITPESSSVAVRWDAQFVYQNAHRVITLTLATVVDHQANDECLVSGVAMPATLQ